MRGCMDSLERLIVSSNLPSVASNRSEASISQTIYCNSLWCLLGHPFKRASDHRRIMLYRYKWRLILSLTNLAIAMGLFAVGLREAEAVRYPHMQMTSSYIPPAQVAAYCINFPAFAFRNAITNWVVYRSSAATAAWSKWSSSYRFQEGFDFYSILALFWWWIGWHCDLKSRNPARGQAAADNCFGFLLSLLLLYGAAQLLLTQLPSGRLRFEGGLIMPTSALVWGLGLLWYFGKRLLSRTPPQPHRPD